ncbi:MAG: O-antigen ligase family protein [Candidatus Woesearchaeota archaeon]
MKNNKFSYDSLLIYLLFLYPVISIITVFTSANPFLAELSISQYAAIILVLTYFLIFRKKLFLRSLLMPFLILYGINILSSSNPWVSIRDIMPINLVINLSILWYSGSFKAVKINEKIKAIIFAITLVGFYVFIIGIDLIKDLYVGSYHAGMFELPHTAAYYLFIIFIYTAVIDKRFNLFYFLSLLGIVLSGVRTAIIALLIFLIIDLFSRFDFSKKENVKYILKFVLVMSLITVFIVLIQPPIIDNVSSRMQELTQFDDLDEYGSGRIGISKFIFSDFEKRNVWQMLTGKPVIEEYTAAEAYFGVTLWAHNDFLMILYVLGAVGLLIYLYYCLLNPILYIFKNNSLRKNRTTFYQSIGLILSVIVLAAGNGFYYYFMAHILLYVIFLINNTPIKSDKIFNRDAI